MMPHLSVVIPAYNEALRLPPTLASVANYLSQQDYISEVVLVDDGSTDTTWQVMTNWCEQDSEHRRCLQLNPNQGKGAAVKAGMLASNGQYTLMMDADNAADISQIERLWPPALDERVPIVIGSRALGSDDVTIQARWYRMILGRLFHQVAKTKVSGIADTQCGFKLFDMSVCRPLFEQLTTTGYTFDIELLKSAQTNKRPIAEMPIDWKHVSGSKVIGFQTVLELFL